MTCPMFTHPVGFIMSWELIDAFLLSLCSVLRHVPGITLGVRLSRLWRDWLLSHHPAGYPERRYEGSACVAIDGSIISGNGNRICLDLCSPVARPGSLTRQISSQVRQISPDRDGNPDFIVTTQPRHLPYLLNPGFRHVVLTYPETGPYTSRFQRDPSAHSFAWGFLKTVFHGSAPRGSGI